MKSITRCSYTPIATYLQGLSKKLVHAGHLGRDAEVDGTVANLDNETATDLRVDLSTLR